MLDCVYTQQRCDTACSDGGAPHGELCFLVARIVDGVLILPMDSAEGRLDQPGFSPADFTTLVHFAMSSAIILPKSAGVPGGSTMPPRSVRRPLSFGST